MKKFLGFVGILGILVLGRIIGSNLIQGATTILSLTTKELKRCLLNN